MIAIPACVVVVAPADGRARPLVAEGTPVEQGEVVAVVDGGTGTTPVRAPARGRVGGALAAERQTVARGEGVMWLSR